MANLEKLKSETIAILRNCRLPVGALPEDRDGVAFIRCRAPSFAAASVAANDIGEDGVFVAHHPDFGDYLRVNRKTRAFSFICQMKS